MGLNGKREQELRPDPIARIQSRRTNNELGMVDIAEIMVGNLLYEAASNSQTLKE